MAEALVLRGRFVGQTFIPDEPLPLAEGDAQRIVFPGTRGATPPAGSLFDLFGKAPRLRTAEDIAPEVREERDAWGESRDLRCCERNRSPRGRRCDDPGSPQGRESVAPTAP
jgi:hypothetical protein